MNLDACQKPENQTPDTSHFPSGVCHAAAHDCLCLCLCLRFRQTVTASSLSHVFSRHRFGHQFVNTRTPPLAAIWSCFHSFSISSSVCLFALSLVDSRILCWSLDTIPAPSSIQLLRSSQRRSFTTSTFDFQFRQPLKAPTHSISRRRLSHTTSFCPYLIPTPHPYLAISLPYAALPL